MFLSLNRKIVYSILSLFLIASLLFIMAFYMAYSSKVEKDQLFSIQRNQQYIDLLYRSINLTKELKQLVEQYDEITIDDISYPQIYTLTHDSQNPDFLIHEQNMIAERSKSFDAQYQTINNGITIISLSALLLAFFIILVGYLIKRWLLTPINKISTISEEIGQGNLNLRIPVRNNIKYLDELDRLSSTFNMMVDNLQNTLSEIKDKEKFLQALIDSIPDGIRVIDKDYNIIIANKTYYKQAGSKASSGLKCYQSSFNIDHPCDLVHTQCPLHELLHTRKRRINIIQQFSHDISRHLAVNAAPVIYDNSHQYIVESIRDLSEDIDFSHQQKLSSLGFLSSSIAHEMKNHLGAIRLITEHLIDHYYSGLPESDEQKKIINMIYSEIINASKVPERLLKLTRGYAETEPTPFNCAESLSDVINILDFEAKSKGINIIFSAPAQQIYINGNEADFKIAAINIILNAIKAMDDRGRLTIKLKKSSSEAIITFTDTGIGIAPKDLPYIFNPFFSEGKQRKDSKNSGLGLAITKSIIEKMGGKISVKSALGKGSCFSLSLPLTKRLQKK